MVKIFLTTVLLLLLFSFFQAKYPVRNGQNMWQENMIRMQDFLYNPNPGTQHIILGSSLSTGIKPKDSTYYNLAAGGGNPFSGLMIIERSNRKIKRLYIESNYLLTKERSDERYVNSLFIPVLYDLRRLLPILREQNQPVTYLAYSGKYLLSLFKGKSLKSTIPSEPLGNNQTKIKRIEQLRKESSDSVLVRQTVADNISLLENYLSYFKENRTELILYEMPVDCALVNQPVPIYCRNKILAFCKKNDVRFIPAPNCSLYNTKDGNHLTDRSLEDYTKFFYQQ